MEKERKPLSGEHRKQAAAMLRKKAAQRERDAIRLRMKASEIELGVGLTAKRPKE